MKQVGVLIPLLPEAAGVIKHPVPNRPLRFATGITLYVSGLGSQRTREGVQSLLDSGAQAFISLGTAGALDPGLRAGDVFVPDRVLRPEGGPAEIHERWRQSVNEVLSGSGLTVVRGNLLHVDEIIRSPEAKRELYETSGASAVDMESATLIEEADRHGLPSLVIRVIVDHARSRVPEAVLANSDAYGRTHVPALLGDLCRQPRQIYDLLRVAGEFRRARRSLQQLTRILQQLSPPG